MNANKVFRANARKQLGGGIFQNNWLMALVVCLLFSLVMGVGGFVSIIVGGFLAFGMCRVFLQLVRGQKEKVDIADLFSGSRQFADLLVLYLLQTLFTVLWTLLFIIPGIIKTFQYSLCHHILVDNPNMSQSEVREESMSMMEGNCLRYLWLHLSFVGWFVLSILSCGVLLFYTIPYMDAATAIFYENLKTRKPYSSENCEICKENQ